MVSHRYSHHQLSRRSYVHRSSRSLQNLTFRCSVSSHAIHSNQAVVRVGRLQLSHLEEREEESGRCWSTSSRFVERFVFSFSRLTRFRPAILKTCLLRRKKDSTLDGKPLVVLPPKTVTLQVLDFSPEEREVYTFVETRSQQKFNKFLKAGFVFPRPPR